MDEYCAESCRRLSSHSGADGARLGARADSGLGPVGVAHGIERKRHDRGRFNAQRAARAMTGEIHPLAPEHLPRFITVPGESDFLFNLSLVLLLVAVVALGSLYFRLHALPERIAHGASQVQYQLVAVLALIALFTHNNLFWVIALLVALVPIPDFWTPLADMATSLGRLARRTSHVPEPEPLPQQIAPVEQTEAATGHPPQEEADTVTAHAHAPAETPARLPARKRLREPETPAS